MTWEGRSTLYDESALRQEVERDDCCENGNGDEDRTAKEAEEDKQALTVIRDALDDDDNNSSLRAVVDPAEDQRPGGVSSRQSAFEGTGSGFAESCSSNATFTRPRLPRHLLREGVKGNVLFLDMKPASVRLAQTLWVTICEDHTVYLKTSPLARPDSTNSSPATTRRTVMTAVRLVGREPPGGGGRSTTKLIQRDKASSTSSAQR